MSRALLLLFALVTPAAAQVVFERPDPHAPRPCYEQSSHVKLTHLSFDALPAGALREELAANGRRFVGPLAGFGCGGGSSDGESLSEGNHEEDCFLRFLNHFWDADTDEGLGNSQDARAYAEGIYRGAVDLYLGGDKPSAWYQLGRVLHLLQDLCNPSHCHLDPHGAADPDNNYEALTAALFDDLLDDGELVGLAPLDAHSLAPTPCPALFADSPKQAQPLFRLFLFVAETTDFFESGDVAGDGDCVGGGESAAAFAARIGHAVGMAPPASGAFTPEHLETHSDVVLPLAIEAGAGLFELFWSDTHVDADGDGRLDGVDPCPDEANDDEDGDGICGGARYLEPMLGAGDDCPTEASRTTPGVCGCSISDDDGDDDGIADCLDLCPDHPDPGQEDSDGDGIGDACLFRFELGSATSPAGSEELELSLAASLGAGCLSSADFRVRYDHAQVGFVAPALAGPGCELTTTAVSDGVFDLAVSCAPGRDGELELASLRFLVPPSNGELALFSIELFDETVTDCAAASVPALGRAGTLTVTCPAGDVDRDGDSDLADLLAARATEGLDCADLSPGPRGCEPLIGAASVCPMGDGSYDDDDRALLRALVAGILRAACEDCDSLVTAALLRAIGDVAPAGGGDGRLDVADVLRVLRFAVGLDAPTEEERLRADVNDDGRLDVADVLAILRAAVGLEAIGWPERELVFRLDEARTLAAWSIRISGWPASARVSGFEALGCPDTPFGGLDQAGGAAAVTCAPASPAMLEGEVLRLRYRAPGPIDPASLLVETSALDANGDPLAVVVGP